MVRARIKEVRDPGTSPHGFFSYPSPSLVLTSTVFPFLSAILGSKKKRHDGGKNESLQLVSLDCISDDILARTLDD